MPTITRKEIVMGFIYTGYCANKTNVFKIGKTADERSPLSRLYANNITETGCIKVPHASKSILFLLESVARVVMEEELKLPYWNKRDDFFVYERTSTGQKNIEAHAIAEKVLNAVAMECEYREIPYEIVLSGFTMRGKASRFLQEVDWL